MALQGMWKRAPRINGRGHFPSGERFWPSEMFKETRAKRAGPRFGSRDWRIPRDFAILSHGWNGRAWRSGIGWWPWPRGRPGWGRFFAVGQLVFEEAVDGLDVALPRGAYGGMERCREPEVRTVAGKPHRCWFSGSSLPLLVCHTFAGVVVSGSSAHGIGGATGMTCGGFMAGGRAQATNHCRSPWRWRADKQSAGQVPCTQGRCPGCFAAPTPPLQEMFFAAGGLVTSRFPTGSTTYPGLPKESARFSLTPPAQPRQGARVASTATRTATLLVRQERGVEA